MNEITLIEKIQQNQAEIAADFVLLQSQNEDYFDDIEALRQHQAVAGDAVEDLHQRMQADIETKEVDNNGN